MQEKTILTEISHRLEQSDRILVVSHVRPDGDAVGSVLAMGLALQQLGKRVQMVLNDGVPASFRFLEGAERIQKMPYDDFDMAFVLDCGDLYRIGEVADVLKTADVNIDHHPTNPKFAALNLVDPTAVSTTALLYRLFPQLGFEFTPGVVDALMTGLITDTQGFRTSNINARALRIAAELVELGADLSDLFFKVLTRKTYEAVRYWGAGLSLIERDGPFVWASLRYEDRLRVEYHGRDDSDLVNFLARIEDALVAMVFIEQEDGTVKVSWRSKKNIDVSKLAKKFGGGGHVVAAGATIEGSLDSVKSRVLQDCLKNNVLEIEGL